MFSSLKIIELSTVLAGPSVGMFFAELGAKVIKIEHPNSPDVTRKWKLPQENKDERVSAYFSSVNYKKEYLKLDLTHPSDHQKAMHLITDADILLVNFKKGDDEKFGLTSTQLWNLNPRLIIGKITGFGSDSDRVAYDLILQAETGFMSMNGTPDSGPVKMPVALIDVLAAHQLKEGILVALLERQITQKGNLVSVSLYDAAVCSLVNQASNYLMEKHIAQPIGSLHPNIAPYGELFETSDNQLVTFAIGSDKHFQLLCQFLELDGVSEQSDFSTNQQRVENRTKIYTLLQPKIGRLDSEELSNSMIELGIPMGIVHNLKTVFENEKAQQLVRTEIIEGKETKRVSSIAFKFEK